jgi:four helix bundle protein
VAVRHYSDLIAWQKAMSLVTEIYKISEKFPRREVYGLTNQVRRAAVSIPSNIAEGQGRGTTKDFCSFLRHAYGSLQEVETQIHIAHRLAYIEDSDRTRLIDQCSEVARILNGLISSLADK